MRFGELARAAGHIGDPPPYWFYGGRGARMVGTRNGAVIYRGPGIDRRRRCWVAAPGEAPSLNHARCIDPAFDVLEEHLRNIEGGRLIPLGRAVFDGKAIEAVEGLTPQAGIVARVLEDLGRQPGSLEVYQQPQAPVVVYLLRVGEELWAVEIRR